MSRKRKPLNDSPARWKRIKKIYGLTREAYLKILQDQGGTCFVCERSPYEIRPRRHLAVDHDHKTGAIRGLLCFNCNHNVIGKLFRDNPRIAIRAVEYLQRKNNYGKIPDSM